MYSWEVATVLHTHGFRLWAGSFAVWGIEDMSKANNKGQDKYVNYNLFHVTSDFDDDHNKLYSDDLCTDKVMSQDCKDADVCEQQQSFCKAWKIEFGEHRAAVVPLHGPFARAHAFHLSSRLFFCGWHSVAKIPAHLLA